MTNRIMNTTITITREERATISKGDIIRKNKEINNTMETKMIMHKEAMITAIINIANITTRRKKIMTNQIIISKSND